MFTVYIIKYNYMPIIFYTSLDILYTFLQISSKAGNNIMKTYANVYSGYLSIYYIHYHWWSEAYESYIPPSSIVVR
jgi:hypothetical protein